MKLDEAPETAHSPQAARAILIGAAYLQARRLLSPLGEGNR
jgi:hypothetical protein